MSGETANISQFCKLAWYKQAKFLSTTVSFPEDQLVFGKYLGPSIDIGPIMATKILTPTGKVVHPSTYRLLTPEELTDPIEEDCMKAFLWTAEERWGSCLER